MLIGDVVGFGKTLMATGAGADVRGRCFGMETLILCPKESGANVGALPHEYGLRGTVLSVTKAPDEADRPEAATSL